MARRIVFLFPLLIVGVALLVATSRLASHRSASASGTAVVSVSAGGGYTCAVTSSGGAKCWGSNSYGQLGDGTTINRSTPVDVYGLTSGVAAVSVGGDDGEHSCALTTAGGVKCWGANFNGQLGNGTTSGPDCSGYCSFTPVDVSGLTSGVAAVSAGFNHTCALTTAGGLKCWGRGDLGQLGDGAPSQSTTPVDVSGLTGGVAAVSSGSYYTCALTTTGGVKCWGFNSFGELGDGTNTGPELCNGVAACSTRPVDVSGLSSGVAAVSAGLIHTCALTTAGGLKCWGANFTGQLGDGTMVDSAAPVSISGLSSGVAAVSAGDYHTCALTSAGALKCWGLNTEGELGDGQACGMVCTPVDVFGVIDAATVSGGQGHTCAVTTAGALKCWGWNDHGELGVGTITGPEICDSSCSTRPVDVIGLEPKPTPTPPPSVGGVSFDRGLGSTETGGSEWLLAVGACIVVGLATLGGAVCFGRRRASRR